MAAGPKRERRRLLAVFLLAIGIPGVVLSYGTLHAVRTDHYVLSKLREERLAAAAREVIEAVDGETRDRARAALAFAGEGDLFRPAEARARLADLEARLEAARGRHRLVREYFVLDEAGRLLVPRGGGAGEERDPRAPGGGQGPAPNAPIDPLDAGAGREEFGLGETMDRYEERQALKRKLASARQFELGKGDPAAARAVYREVATDPADPELAARARLDLARCSAKIGETEAALGDLDVLARLGPELRTDTGLSIAAAARLRAGELRIAAGTVDEGAARLIELASDIVDGRFVLPERQALYFAERARAEVEAALPALSAPAYRTALERLALAEKRFADTRAYAREFARRVLPDIRAIVEAGMRPDEVQLATLGGEAPRLLALRMFRERQAVAGGTEEPEEAADEAAAARGDAREGAPPEARGFVVGAELDLEVLVAETLAPELERIAGERGAALAVTDRRGRTVAAAGESDLAGRSGAERAGTATEAFEAIFPFWRVRAAPAHPDDEAAVARFRLLLQIGMVALLTVAMGVGALFTLLAIHRSFELARLESEFVSQVSHELRTPLTSIRMFAELLRTGRARTPEKEKEYLALIDAESARLQKLIDDILDFDRHESGRKEYRFEPADAGALAEEAMGALGPPLVQAGFKIDLEVRRPLPPVRLDRKALRAAIENLVSNAGKYAAERRHIAVRAFADPGGVVIEVADAGVGIDEDELPRIFDKFFRGRDAAELGVPGSGLGLTLVKRIVEDHGGKVGVRSRKGEGTTFWIALPAAG